MGQSASGPGAMPRGWRLSYYSRIAEACGSAPAPEHAGGVSFQVSPCGTRPSGFGAKDKPFRQKALPSGCCLFVFALTKYTMVQLDRAFRSVLSRRRGDSTGETDMFRKGGMHAAAICVLLFGLSVQASAVPFSSHRLPEATPLKVVPVVVFGKNSRRSVEEFAAERKLQASELRTRFASSGLIACGDATGAGHLTR